MSNPGVLKLVQLADSIEGFPYRFDVEDNIGEAIHIHYRDIRLDLTIAEFVSLAGQIEAIYNKIINVDGFSCSKFDKVNLVGLSALVPYLEEIREETLSLNELYTIGEDSQGRQVIVPLRDSRVVKALNGDTWENDHREQINYYDLNELRVQSNAERLAYNLEEIKENGYPSSDERIILFNDSNVIRDGGHRAGVLYKLYGGEYRVPIRRLLFRNSRFSDICDIEAIEHIDVSDVPELIIRGNEVEIDLHSLLKDNNTVMAEISRKTEESDDNTEG